VQGYGVPSEAPEAVVVLNDQPASRELLKRYSITPSRSVLVVLEPRVTAPTMYTKRCLARYGHRFAASPNWATLVGGTSFLWPQELRTTKPIPTNEFETTLINGEKRSAVKGSQYGLRRAAIAECSAIGVSAAVFGPGWAASAASRTKEAAKALAKAGLAGSLPDVPEALGGLSFRPARPMGTIEEKAAAFRVAPSSIVIENSADYVSEKLVDALCAGVVPIYVGPPLDRFDIPGDVAVTCPPDPKAIANRVRSISASQAQATLSAGLDWLSGPAKEHEITKVLRSLGESIGERLAES